MTDLSPEIQQLILTFFLWLLGAMGAVVIFLGGIVLLGGKFFAGKVVEKVDSLETAIKTVGDDAVEGFRQVTAALNNHHNDLSGRIGRADGKIGVLEFKTENIIKDVDNIYPRIAHIEQGHAALSATVEKIIHPVGRQ